MSVAERLIRVQLANWYLLLIVLRQATSTCHLNESPHPQRSIHHAPRSLPSYRYTSIPSGSVLFVLLCSARAVVTIAGQRSRERVLSSKCILASTICSTSWPLAQRPAFSPLLPALCSLQNRTIRAKVRLKPKPKPEPKCQPKPESHKQPSAWCSACLVFYFLCSSLLRCTGKKKGPYIKSK